MLNPPGQITGYGAQVTWNVYDSVRWAGFSPWVKAVIGELLWFVTWMR